MGLLKRKESQSSDAARRAKYWKKVRRITDPIPTDRLVDGINVSGQLPVAAVQKLGALEVAGLVTSWWLYRSGERTSPGERKDLVQVVGEEFLRGVLDVDMQMREGAVHVDSGYPGCAPTHYDTGLLYPGFGTIKTDWVSRRIHDPRHLAVLLDLAGPFTYRYSQEEVEEISFPAMSSLEHEHGAVRWLTHPFLRYQGVKEWHRVRVNNPMLLERAYLPGGEIRSKGSSLALTARFALR